MPTTQLQLLEAVDDELQPLGFSRDELREISLALADQIDTLVHIDAAVHAKHIDRSRTALAKALGRLGQAAGDKCFRCRKPLVATRENRQAHCADGCLSPSEWLRSIGHAD